MANATHVDIPKRGTVDSQERGIARIAWAAVCNTVFGGFSAAHKGERIARISGNTDYIDAVCAVYSASTGKPHPDYSFFECRECGSVHFGRDNAERCCTEEYLGDFSDGHAE